MNTIINENVKISNLYPVKRLVNELIKLEFKPYLIINIDDFVFKNSNAKELIFPNLKEIIKSLEESGNFNQLIFLTNRSQEYYYNTYWQLNKLLKTSKFTIIMKDEKNFTIAIEDYINIDENIKFSYNPYILYLDNNINRCIKADNIFTKQFIKHTCFILNKDQSFYDYFLCRDIEIIN